MPFTPVHFGLGALPGGATSRVFSFRTFCFANVVIDLEALVRIPLGLHPIHDWLHTFLLGTAVPLALVFPVGRPFCLWVSRVWNGLSDRSSLSARFPIPESIAALPTATGAIVGGISHVFLDSVMHSDIHPLRPFSDANPFLDLVGIWPLHAMLAIAGLIGFLVYAGRVRRK